MPIKPVSMQERSKRTEQLLLDAALDLATEKGFEELTVAAIAERAGVAPASIYRRFGDKENLLREMYAYFAEGVVQLLDAHHSAKQSQTPIAMMADLTAKIFRFSLNYQQLLRSSYAKALTDPFFAKHVLDLRTEIHQRLKNDLKRRTHKMVPAVSDVAFDFVIHQAVALFSARIEAGHLMVQDTMSDSVFVREFMRSVLSYLQLPFSVAEIDQAMREHGL